MYKQYILRHLASRMLFIRHRRHTKLDANHVNDTLRRPYLFEQTLNSPSEYTIAMCMRTM
jgi:hypothetical protein